MPELPEMENYKIQLSQHILDKKITKVVVNRPKSINTSVEQFEAELRDRHVIFIERRAKHLIFHLDNGRRLVLHLMLGGLLYLGSDEDRLDRTTQIEISFGDKVLFFIGLRLGYLHLLTAKEIDEKFGHLGPEPLHSKMTEAKFIELISSRKGSIKTTLTNQDVIAGIGNCYVDEIAFEAKLRPSVKIQNLNEEDLRELYHAMRKVLITATQAGGYMESPLMQGDTLTGGSNDLCVVYDEEGSVCPRCGDTIVKGEINGKKMFYSPGCQHEK